MAENLTTSKGPWLALPVVGCVEICDEKYNVLGMAHELGDAALMAAAPALLDALIDIHEALEDVEDGPFKDLIETRISLAVETLAAEAGAH